MILCSENGSFKPSLPTMRTLKTLGIVASKNPVPCLGDAHVIVMANVAYEPSKVNSKEPNGLQSPGQPVGWQSRCGRLSCFTLIDSPSESVFARDGLTQPRPGGSPLRATPRRQLATVVWANLAFTRLFATFADRDHVIVRDCDGHELTGGGGGPDSPRRVAAGTQRACEPNGRGHSGLARRVVKGLQMQSWSPHLKSQTM